jgi:hypothetical protein
VRGVVTLTDTTAPYEGTLNTATVADGAGTISATAFDTAGNATTSSRNVVIDNTKPSLAVAGPDDQSFAPASTQTWTIAAADGGSGLSGVVCSLVAFGSPPVFGACSGGGGSHSASGLAEGAYALTVRARDAAGNTTDATRRFKIDGTAPETTISSGLGDGATTTDTSLTWGLSASETGTTFECRVYPAALTPGGFGTCNGGPSHTASGFAPGTYAFESRAIDGAGNVDPTPAKRIFTVASPPPPVVVPAPLGAPPVQAGPASAPQQIVVTLAFSFTSTRKRTKLKQLVIRNIPAGSTVTVHCPKGCPKKKFKKSRVRGKLSLKAFTKRSLKVRTKITVTVSRPGASSAVKVLKIRARRAPLVTTLCRPEGASKPTAC